MGEINISVTQKLIKNPAYGFEFYPDKISDKTKEVRLKLTSKFPSKKSVILLIFCVISTGVSLKTTRRI